MEKYAYTIFNETLTDIIKMEWMRAEKEIMKKLLYQIGKIALNEAAQDGKLNPLLEPWINLRRRNRKLL